MMVNKVLGHSVKILAQKWSKIIIGSDVIAFVIKLTENFVDAVKTHY